MNFAQDVHAKIPPRLTKRTLRIEPRQRRPIKAIHRPYTRDSPAKEWLDSAGLMALLADMDAQFVHRIREKQKQRATKHGYQPCERLVIKRTGFGGSTDTVVNRADNLT